ncbi:protein adenylyltransferase SelO family protein, partial [Achromobacter dolens]
IDRYYPECRAVPAGEAPSDTAPYVRLLREVTRRTALLMADWQAVGFCHGVMNTDNMSILGLTLDYGPYGFMDGFRLGHVCNHSDSEGRYSWNRQPSVALWNLYRLGGSLHTLVQDVDALRAVLDEFEGVFTRAFHDRMGAKMGLAAWRPADEPLLDDLLKLMDANQADFTLAWRRLADAVSGNRAPFQDLFIDREAAAGWLDRLLARHAQDGRPATEVAEAMNRVNPLYVLRNHLAEEAIRAAKTGDAGEIETLMTLLREPFTARAGYEKYASLPPDWANGIEVSCSS